jgi:hypothetical protein
VLLLLAAPAQNDRSPRYMEKALAAIHQSGLGGEPITLVYGPIAGQVGLLVRCAESQREFVVGPVEANYPQAAVTEVDPSALAPPPGTTALVVDLDLSPEIFPLLRHGQSQFEDLLNRAFADPADSLLRAIRPDTAVHARVEITVRPASHLRCHDAAEAVRRLDREFFRHRHRLAGYFARNYTRGRMFGLSWALGRLSLRTPPTDRRTLDASTSRGHEREEDLQAAADKVGSHLFETRIRLVVSAPAAERRRAVERLQSLVGAFGAFTRSRLARFRPGPVRREGAARPGPSFLCSHEELATLWHPPVAASGTEKLTTTAFTEFEAPAVLPDLGRPGAVTLGRVRFRSDARLVGLDLDARRRHVYVVGKTGMGKTTLLQNMLAGDMRAGLGVGLIDPHGDLADALVGLVPKHRTNDVILFDAGNPASVLGFNPLACPDPDRIDLVTSGVVSAFKKLHDSWGPRLEDTLRNAVFAVVERGGNLMDVTRLLGERAYRERTVILIRDEVVRSFWLNEFAAWSDTYRTEAVAAIQNKVRPFLGNRTVRAIVTAPGPGLNLRETMDGGRILIVNLSKGRLGEDNATLLGAFLVTSIQQAAMTRSDTPEAERRDWTCYVDEFQNFQTGSFDAVLSEARKYRLNLVCVHQFLSQLSEPVANAVWGNVGSIIAFQVGSDDAARLAGQLGQYPDQVGPEHLTGLPKYTAFARLLIDGTPSPPFTMQTLPPPAAENDPHRAEIVRRVAGRHRREVDASGRIRGERNRQDMAAETRQQNASHG